MSMLRIARLVAAKDLRIEWNSRVFVNQVLPFAGVTMVIFAFALDADAVLQRVAPGLVWLATLFSMLVLVQRAFAVETADGALDALRVEERAEVRHVLRDTDLARRIEAARPAPQPVGSDEAEVAGRAEGAGQRRKLAAR